MYIQQTNAPAGRLSSAWQINVIGLRFAGQMLLLAAYLVFLMAMQSAANPTLSHSSQPYVVTNDRGGLLKERLAQIRSLRQSGQPVRIIGGACYSTCTMLVGLPQTCISPNTVFGFHGPSSYGRALAPAAFNRASRVISSYYPPRLQRWYMEKGRFRIRTLYRVRGAQLIRMGVPSCELG